MKSTHKLPYIGIPFGIALAAFLTTPIAFAQVPPLEPLCGGKEKPSGPPSCKRNSLNRCIPAGCDDPSAAGAFGLYCCYDISVFQCKEFHSRWECCNDKWVQACEMIVFIDGTCGGQHCTGI